MGINVNAMLIVVIVCLSMTIMPSAEEVITSPTPTVPGPPLAPGCLMNIGKCVAKENGAMTDPTAKLDYSKCCSVIETEVTTNATCFCSLEEYYKNATLDYEAAVKNLTETLNNTNYNPPPLPPFSEVELEYNKVFDECGIDTTFSKMCQDVSASASSEEGKMSENGATKIKSVMGLISGALFVWTTIMFY